MSVTKLNAPAALRDQALYNQLQLTRNALPEALTLPSAVYTSEEILKLEQSHIFESMWLNVCRQEDLAEPGDFITRQIGAERILIIRDSNRDIQAFYNVCRHRGSQLVDEESGKARLRIACPYHGWTYEADGSLLNAPLSDKSFCKEDYGLNKVRLGTYGGFVFINLDPDTEPLESYLSDLPDLSRYKMESLRRGYVVEYEVNANWKFIIENYSECYHCRLVHPQLDRISDYRSGGMSYQGKCFNGGPMQINDGFTTLSMSGQSSLPVIPGLSEEDHKQVNYFCIYPNFLLSPHPDYLLVHTLLPVSVNKTYIKCEWFFTQSAIEDEQFDLSDVTEFWDMTNKQDWGLCERAQKGAASKGYQPGPYNELEECVHMFDKWYAEKISQLLV